MLNSPTTGKRTAGKLLIVSAVALALPLTATRAIDYVDVAPPAPPAPPAAPAAPAAPQAPAAPMALAALAAQREAPAAPLPPLAPIAPVAPLAPVAPTPPAPPAYHGDINIDDNMVTINGRTKRWNQLTPAEKQQVRAELARAREELRNTHIDRAEIDRDIREAMADVKIDHREMARDLAEAKVEIDRALREVDAHAGDIRRAGHDPEAIKAQVRASLKAVQAIDVEAIRRQALASVDPAKIAASVAAAEASIARAQAELDRLESKLSDD